MRILITTDWYKPTINGVVTSVLNLAEGLRELGHEVKILTLSGDMHSRVEGDEYYIGSVPAGKVYPNARIQSSRGKKLIRELCHWHPDVVHSQCEFSTFHEARVVSRVCRIPMIHTYHTVYEDYTHYFSPNRTIGRIMAVKLTKRYVSKTDGVVVPAAKIRDLLEKYRVSKPIYLLPTGLDLDPYLRDDEPEDRDALRKTMGLEPGDVAFMYLGRLAKEKNVSELLRFMKEQAPEGTKFIIVGGGPYKDELVKETGKLEIGDRVVFTGMVQPDRVPEYYRCGDIFLSASRSETQGLTYMEAMASGLPLLCRKDECLRDVIRQGETGYVYESLEEAGKIAAELVSDPELRGRIGRAARTEMIEKFSIRTFAENAVKIYEKSIADRADKRKSKA